MHQADSQYSHSLEDLFCFSNAYRGYRWVEQREERQPGALFDRDEVSCSWRLRSRSPHEALTDDFALGSPRNDDVSSQFRNQRSNGRQPIAGKGCEIKQFIDCLGFVLIVFQCSAIRSNENRMQVTATESSSAKSFFQYPIKQSTSAANTKSTQRAWGNG